jgi:hypothetical protein
MTTIHVAALAAVLLFAISDSSFAVTKVLKKHYSHGPHPYSHGPHPYGRDNPQAPGVNWPDPYAPGVNWPKGA